MKPLDMARAVLVMAIWGINFSVAKIMLAEIPPLLGMVLRFGMVAVLLLPMVRFPKGKFWHLLGYSFILGTVHFPLMFAGVRGADASTASIAIQLQVPFASLLAAVFMKDTLGWRRAGGMAIAFAGIAIIAGEPRAGVSLPHLGLVVLAAFAFAFSNLQVKWMGSVQPLALNAYTALLALPQLILMSLLIEHGQIDSLTQASPKIWLCVTYMAVMSSMVSYTLWYPLVGKYSVNQTMPFLLLVPVFGVASGVLMLGEPLTVQLVLGGMVTISGVAVIILRRPRLIQPQTQT